MRVVQLRATGVLWDFKQSSHTSAAKVAVCSSSHDFPSLDHVETSRVSSECAPVMLHHVGDMLKHVTEISGAVITSGQSCCCFPVLMKRRWGGDEIHHHIDLLALQLIWEQSTRQTLLVLRFSRSTFIPSFSQNGPEKIKSQSKSVFICSVELVEAPPHLTPGSLFSLWRLATGQVHSEQLVQRLWTRINHIDQKSFWSSCCHGNTASTAASKMELKIR